MIAKSGRLSLTETKILERIITYGLEGVSSVAPKFIDSTDERIEQGAKHGRIIERLIEEHKIENNEVKTDGKQKKKIKRKKVTSNRKITKKKTASNKRRTGTKGGRKQTTKKTLKEKLKSPSKITIFFN